MKKTMLLIVVFCNIFYSFSQQNLFFGYTNKYFVMEFDRYIVEHKIDTNKCYFIKDIKNTEKLEIKEYGEVFNHRKFGLWTGVNEQNEIVCHRFYNNGYLQYDIMYCKNKIYALVNYGYNPVILDDWRDEEDIRDIEGNYQVTDIIFYTKDGKIKKQYYDNGSEYIEKNHNKNEVTQIPPHNE